METSNCRALAAKLEADEDGLERLLTALGLASRIGDEFHLSDLARDCLVEGSPHFLGNIVRHQSNLVDKWSRLADRIVDPDRQQPHADDAFLMGMFDLGSLYGSRVVSNLELESAERLLDLGGGPGAFAIEFCKVHPQLNATVFDRPDTRAFAERQIAKAEMSERISVEEGDFTTERFDASYDVVWGSHILHQEGREGVLAILATASSALKTGGRLIIQEFLIEDGSAPPRYPALFSLNMLLCTESGRAYTVRQVCALLEEAGFTSPRFVPCAGNADLVIGDKG